MLRWNQPVTHDRLFEAAINSPPSNSNSWRQYARWAGLEALGRREVRAPGKA